MIGTEPGIAETHRPGGLPLDQVTTPGAYVCHGSGDLIRVVDRGHDAEAEALLARHDRQPVYVTQISPNPFVPISVARVAAANLDLEVNF